MAIYVDSLMTTSKKFCGGYKACHMATDGDLKELHDFACRIGMRRSWFQDHPRIPHYDLTEARREEAIRLGAEAISGRDFVIKCVRV